jgi:hypothetical protein
VFCPNCGAPVKGRVCEYCGSVMAMEPKKSAPKPVSVQNVGATRAAAAQNVESAPARVCAKPLKDKWVAFTLCLLLGFFGAHKFYEGKTGLGVLYLLTAGLYGLGWFVDLIVLLCKPDRYVP